MVSDVALALGCQHSYLVVLEHTNPYNATIWGNATNAFKTDSFGKNADASLRLQMLSFQGEWLIVVSKWHSFVHVAGRWAKDDVC